MNGLKSTALILKGFNSNLVRLKVCWKKSERKLLTSFNSNLVRLKDDVSFFIFTFVLMFQFQSGAIKSILFAVKRNSTFSFQFQSGAIKRNEVVLDRI